MVWQHTPYTFPLIAAATVSVLSAFYILRRRHTPASRTGVLLLLAAAGWMTGYALQQASVDLAAKVFWSKMEFVAGGTMPMLWLIYTLQYSGRERWLQWRSLVLLNVVPFVTLLLVFTNEAHGLIWERVWLDTSGPFSVRHATYGLGLWIYAAYAYTMAVAGALMLVQVLRRSGQLYRRRASVLLLAVMATAVANGLRDLARWDPFPYVELTPFVMALAVPIVGLIFYRLRRRDIVPVARDAVIEGMGDGVLVLDAHEHIVDLNPAAEDLIGSSRSQAVGQSLAQLWPEWADRAAHLRSGADASYEIVLRQGDERRTLDVRISPLFDWRRRLVSRVIVLRDVTERVEAEAQLAASLGEKEVLLKEIHHRVKNNLQIISSLLNLQSDHVQDQPALQVFQDSQHRIQSMALIHEKLYQSQDLSKIDLAEYVRNLADFLRLSYGVDEKNVTLSIQADEVFLSVNDAVPCGLILNELVSNALLHAFPEGQRGEIYVSLCGGGDRPVTLSVTDDGVGLPPGLDFRNTPSLGLQLVNLLVGQLEGEIELDCSRGTAFRVTFVGSA